ncbi:MAG: hypothetical protein KKF41_05870 [Actinobacteria bacterium]|nr:hypothetical protein [Actinomycetota bacterium]MBU1944841.1 hypothetical protein [Actinomycetota bacterium]MBU2687092.1 hypothetical protein [Actinomycetota bacterium]
MPKRVALVLCVAMVLCALGSPASRAAATWYIGPEGQDGNPGTQGQPWKTFAHAFAAMAPGDTLVVQDGTYTERMHDPRSGTPGAYTTVRAEHDGGAIIDGALLGQWETPLDAYDCGYVRIEGFEFKGGRAGGTGNTAAFLAGCDHVKLLRCAFYDPSTRSSVEDEGDPAYPGATNYHTFSMDRCSYVLLEDCWAWGYGRYRFESHESDHVVFRRCVGRYDRMHAHYPLAVFSIYRSPYNQLQNCIAVDSDQNAYYTGESGFYGGLVSPNNGDDWNNHDMKALGCIALNVSGGAGFNCGITYGEQTLRDTVVWDCFGGIAYGVPTGADVEIDHVTVGATYGTHEDIHPAGGVGAICWSDGAGTSVTNSLFTDNNEYGLFDLRGSDYNDFWDNGADYGNSWSYSHTVAGPHDRHQNPGLKYIVRPEPGSALEGEASDGGDIGATVLKRYGAAGSLWGEPGFETLTGQDLWPWPFESRIRADMRSYAGPPSGARGFCADGMTLTKYIWEYLGNPMPDFPSPPRSAWYLAEGTTAWGFDTYLRVMNPNDTPVTARVTYMTDTGPQARPDLSLPAMSGTTINPSEDIGVRDFSTTVVCLEGMPIAADRTMSWTGPGAPSPEAHSSVGVTEPGRSWYLPEGSSAWGFECWLLIGNPNDSEAECTVTYMTEGSGPLSFVKRVPAGGRATFNMFDDIGAADASIKVESDLPVVPERAMYRNNRRAGHDSIGVHATSCDWYLAEGTTAWGFESYVLVQNPGDGPASVTLTAMTPDGPVALEPFVMDPQSRRTLRMSEMLPGCDFSLKVHSDAPVAVERAMYWDSGSGEACHDSVGIASPRSAFYLADGRTSGGCETWILVQNPNGEPVGVEISYLTETGESNVTFTGTVPADSRNSYSMAERLPDGVASVLVRSLDGGRPIVVERAMYWNDRGAGTDTIGAH